MKRLILIVGAFTLWIALGTSCYIATELIEPRMSKKCEVKYTYKNQNGETKTSPRCFETEDGNVCKDKAKLVKANKVIEKRICKK
jgi:hypothetical protein